MGVADSAVTLLGRLVVLRPMSSRGLLAVSLAYLVGALASCGGGGDGNSPDATLEPVNPNIVRFMTLEEGEIGDGYEKTSDGFVFVEQAEDLGVPSGWATGYQSIFEAKSAQASPVDEVTGIVELYFDPAAIEKNVKNPIMESADDKFDPGVGEDSAGYGASRGPEGEPRPLYFVRFRRGPVIATVSVKGQSDLSPDQARETAVEYAKSLDEKIMGVLENPPISPPPP